MEENPNERSGPTLRRDPNRARRKLPMTKQTIVDARELAIIDFMLVSH